MDHLSGSKQSDETEKENVIRQRKERDKSYCLSIGMLIVLCSLFLLIVITDLQVSINIFVLQMRKWGWSFSDLSNVPELTSTLRLTDRIVAQGPSLSAVWPSILYQFHRLSGA